LQINVCVCT